MAKKSLFMGEPNLKNLLRVTIAFYFSTVIRDGKHHQYITNEQQN